MTLGDATFLGRAGSTFRATVFLIAFFAGLVFADKGFRFAADFEADLDAPLEALAERGDFLGADFGAAARFALGFDERGARVRLLTDALRAPRRAAEPERLNPFVAGLLIFVLFMYENAAKKLAGG